MAQTRLECGRQAEVLERGSALPPPGRRPPGGAGGHQVHRQGAALRQAGEDSPQGEGHGPHQGLGGGSSHWSAEITSELIFNVSLSEGEHVLTLSIPACKTASSRQLSVWNLRHGNCLHKIQVQVGPGAVLQFSSHFYFQGAIGGFPALRYPHVFLPSANKGLEVWRVAGDSGKVVAFIIKVNY